MTTINNPTLANYLNGNNSSNSAQNSAASLADVLSGNSKTTTQTSQTPGSSYLLDLSDEARAYLAKTQADQAASSKTGDLSLNQAQQAKLNEIIAKYKDAPYTDETFYKIQEDMDKAGLNPEIMATKAQVRQVNPTLMLLDALNGGQGNIGMMGSREDINTQVTNFMKKVADQWKAISTTADEVEATS